MRETVDIQGDLYTVERNDQQIHLSRYNEKYKMWIHLYFPTQASVDGENVLRLMASEYIENYLRAVSGSSSGWTKMNPQGGVTVPVRVACLYRVSTKKQLEENDIPMQKNACRAFVEARPDWVIVREYMERGISGWQKSLAQRDVLQQMKKDAMEGCFQVLLVFMFDRLGRREEETPFVLEWLAEQGIEIWSVKEGRQQFDSRVDKLLNYIRFWQSGGESEKTSIRVSEKHRQMVLEGQFRGGTPPFGYRLVDTEEKNRQGQTRKQLDEDPEEAAVVRLIFSLCTDYGMGGTRTAAFLNQRGIKTRLGRNWTAQGVRSVLCNPVYKGDYISGRTRNRQGKREKTEPSRWVYGPSQFPALVSEQEFQKALQLRTGRVHQGAHIRSPGRGDLLCAGVVICGNCGKVMHSRYLRRKWRSRSQEENRYVQPCYACTQAEKGSCTGQRRFSSRKVDPMVEKLILFFLSTIQKQDLENLCRILVQNENDRKEKQRGREARRLKQLEQQRRRVQEEMIAYLEGKSAFSLNQLQGMDEVLAAEVDKLQQAVTENMEAGISLDAQMLHKIPENAGEMYQRCSLQTRKAVAVQMIDRIYLSKDRIELFFSEAYFL